MSDNRVAAVGLRLGIVARRAPTIAAMIVAAIIAAAEIVEPDDQVV